MNISLITKKSAKLKEYLDENLTGNNIVSYNSLEEIYNEVKLTNVRTKLLIVDDNCINVDNGFDIFYNLVMKQRFFYVTKIIILNFERNESNREKYEYLKPQFEDKGIKVSIYTQGSFQPSFIASLCKTDLDSYDKKVFGDIAVIQKKRKSKIDMYKDISDNTVYKDTVINIGLDGKKDYNVNQRFKNDNTILNEPAKIPISDDYSFYPEFDISNELTIQPKVIAVIGTRNTGVTSTTFSLAYSCAKENMKTLMIDLDTISMGLSHLVEHNINNNLLDLNINNIKLESMENIGTFSKVRNEFLNIYNLHCISISLKMMNKIDDLTYIVLSIINNIKNDYDKIFIDIPIQLFDTYTTLVDELVDGIVIAYIPTINKAVNSLNEIVKSNIMNTRQFKDNKVILFSCGVYNYNEIPIIEYETLKYYVDKILHKQFPITNIFSLGNGYYCNMINNILNKLSLVKGRLE